MLKSRSFEKINTGVDRAFNSKMKRLAEEIRGARSNLEGGKNRGDVGLLRNAVRRYWDIVCRLEKELDRANSLREPDLVKLECMHTETTKSLHLAEKNLKRVNNYEYFKRHDQNFKPPTITEDFYETHTPERQRVCSNTHALIEEIAQHQFGYLIAQIRNQNALGSAKLTDELMSRVVKSDSFKDLIGASYTLTDKQSILVERMGDKISGGNADLGGDEVFVIYEPSSYMQACGSEHVLDLCPYEERTNLMLKDPVMLFKNLRRTLNNRIKHWKMTGRLNFERINDVGDHKDNLLLYMESGSKILCGALS